MTGPFSAASRDKLLGENLDLSGEAQQLLSSFLSVIDEFTEQIRELETVIEDTAASLEETQLLMMIPGLSFFSGLLIHAEIGEIGRFDRSEELVSYAGLDPVVRESGGTRKEGGISKKGNAALRWILVQCANVAVGRADDRILAGSTPD